MIKKLIATTVLSLAMMSSLISFATPGIENGGEFVPLAYQHHPGTTCSPIWSVDTVEVIVDGKCFFGQQRYFERTWKKRSCYTEKGSHFYEYSCTDSGYKCK